MTAAALLLRAFPPLGLGYYVREQLEPGPWSFAFVNAWRRDRGEQIAQLRAQGVEPWLYGTPERFHPDNWREGVAHLDREAERLPVAGVMADGETQWPDLSGARRREEGRAFGAALRAMSERRRVGFTSYPSWPAFEPLAEECAGFVFGSVQIYGRSAFDAEAFASWFDRWRELFGATQVIPSIAGWPASPRMRTADGFAQYLSMLPRAAGAIVWDETGAMPAYIREALATFEPGGNRAGSLALAGAQVAGHKPFMAAAAVVLVIVVALALARARGGA